MPRMTDKDCIALFESLSPETKADILHLAELAKRRIEMSRSKSDYILGYQAGVDVKPIQRPAEPSLEEDEFDSMPIEKINQYLREHGA